MKQRFFSFEGRIGRGTYLWTTLGLTAALIAILLVVGLPVLLLGIDQATQKLTPGAAVTLALLYLVVFVFGTWANLAAGAKRWHDLGRSGWLMLVLYIPLVGFIAWCYMAFVPGQEGGNEYGLPPV